MNNPRDIPRRIARFLFIVGVFWGLVLVVPTIASIGLSFQRGFRGWIIVGYLLSGFAVWGGWLWRSRQLRSLEGSVGLWVSSFVVNAAFPVILVATQSRWPQIFLHDEMRFLLWWWILASVLSVVAGVAEFKVLRHEVPAS
ncbi:MAG: hypothetical protein U0795_17620 [Pirellulales bacterium]